MILFSAIVCNFAYDDEGRQIKTQWNFKIEKVNIELKLLFNYSVFIIMTYE